MSCLIRAGFFGAGGVKKRLARATFSIKEFCKNEKKTLALRKFSQDNLNLKAKVLPDTQSVHGCVFLFASSQVHSRPVIFGRAWKN